MSNLFITGGLGDIGVAVARRFLQEGWSVAVNDLDPPSRGHRRLEQALGCDGSRCLYLQGDCAEADHVERMAVMLEQWGVPDVAAINAGVVETCPLLECSAETWRRQIDCNLTGAFLAARMCARLMARQRRGLLLFTGSWVSAVPRPGLAAYCVSKAGLDMLARQMALELAPLGIRVNVVAPGVVDAGLSGQLFRSGLADPEEFARRVPLGRLQSAEEVAGAFWLLARPEAGYLTGARVLCDGGLSLHMD